MSKYDETTGDFNGELCPRCDCEMLENKLGDKWCSECEYDPKQFKSPRVQVLEDLKRIKLNLKSLIDAKQMDQAIILQDAILVLKSFEEFVLDGE